MDSNKKVLGIIGGMGPLATADLFHKIILWTEASTDSEHIHVLIDNNPKIPDRTEAVINGNNEPLEFMVESAQRLEQMGADILTMPCNTSHVFYKSLCESIKVPIINMIDEVAKQLSTTNLRKAGLLATDGTLYGRLYENALDKYNIEVIHPSKDGQKETMQMIYKGVKACVDQYDTASIKHELSDMMDRGAQTFILGCTELPVAFQKYNVDFPSVDPTVILAKAAIKQAGYVVKK